MNKLFKSSGMFVLILACLTSMGLPVSNEAAEKPIVIEKPAILEKTAVLELEIASGKAVKINPDRLALEKEKELRALELKTLKEQAEALLKTLGPTGVSQYPKRMVETPKTVFKELQLFLDLEKAKATMTDLDHQYADKLTEIGYNMTIMYLDLLEKEANITYDKQQLFQLEQVYPELYKNYLNGTRTQAEIEMNLSQTKTLKERIIKTELEAEVLRTKISVAIGEKDLSKWILNPVLPETTTKELSLSKATTHALQTQTQMKVAMKEEKAAEKAVEGLLYFLKLQYGESAQAVIKLVTDKTKSYEDIFAAYLKVLSNEPAEVALTYPINIGEVSVEAPLSELKSDWPGYSYLKEERYPLMAALTNRDLRIHTANSLRKQLTEDLEKQWLKLTQAETDLQILRQALALEKLRGEKLLKESLTGKIPYSSVLNSKAEEVALTQRILLAQIQFKRLFETMDYRSAGGFSAQLK